VAGNGGIRRPTWGSGEEREAGFEIRIPAISGAGASGRERGVGAGNAAHARTWPTWPGRGGGEGAAAVAGAAARREVGDGSDRWASPVGDPGREEGARAELGRGLRPAQEGAGREEGKWASGPLREKEKEKRKRKKGIFRDLNIAYAQF
jgi:hypothetical protein